MGRLFSGKRKFISILLIAFAGLSFLGLSSTPSVQEKTPSRQVEVQATPTVSVLTPERTTPTPISVTLPESFSTLVPPMPTKKETGVSGNWNCNCSKTCAQMSSCAEAQYQLNICGCGRRDTDNDGIACDADCQ